MEELVSSMEFRHAIYVKALELYLSYVKKKEDYGLCQVIDHSLRYHIGISNWNSGFMNVNISNYREFDPYVHMEAWPEINKYAKSVNNYWFPRRDKESRIKILEEAIEETK